MDVTIVRKVLSLAQVLATFSLLHLAGSGLIWIEPIEPTKTTSSCVMPKSCTHSGLAS